MGELYNPFPKLPKNIRQMGERDDVVKLYVEDYVNTYLKRLYPAGGQDLKAGLLLGSVENHDGTPYIFVDGALEMEDVTASGERVVFTEAAWKKAYQRIEETFPKRTVQGWFLCGAPGCTLSPLNYWKQHGQYFGGKNQLMYLNSGIDGDESIYITSNDGFYRLKGYSVFYERNQMMQDYMILRKDVRRVESSGGDQVIRSFRQRMEGRKLEAVSRRGTVRTLGMICSVLSVAVLAGGVVMFSNYQKMKEMESVLVSVLPSGSRAGQNPSGGKDGDGPVVEEIRGEVYPTQAKSYGDSEISPQALPTEAAQGGQAVGQKTEEAGGQRTEEAGGQKTEEAGGQRTEEAGGQKTEEAGGQAGAAPGVSAQQAGTSADPSRAGSSASSAGGSSSPSGEGAAISSSEPSSAGSAGGSSGAEVTAGGNATADRDFPVTNMKPGDTYMVQDGETLYGICFKLYDSLKYLNDICALNELSDENKIIAGQNLILPDLSEIQ